MKPFPMPSTEPRPLAVRLHLCATLNAKCKMVEARDGLSTEAMILTALALFVDLLPDERAVLVHVAKQLMDRRSSR